MANKIEVKGIRNRTPLSKSEIDNSLTSVVLTENLEHLSLDQLKERYLAIHGQSQMMKGMILLEARERTGSDKEFGKWVSTIGLSDSSSYQTRSVYMNFARFFKNRGMTGISVTAAYAISAPDSANVAEEVYLEALDKNLSVKDVKFLIKQKKAIAIGKDEFTSESSPEDKGKMVIAEENVEEIIALVNSYQLPEDAAIELLKVCMKKIRATVKVNVPE